jgi:hypothetical protein
MPGGRPPQPLNVAMISGAVRKNPQRYRARQAAAKKLAAPQIGPPPQEWLDGLPHNGRCVHLVRIWNDFVEQDRIGLKVLNATHRMLVRNATTLQYKIERATEGYGKATSGDYSNLRSYLASMGMTPLDSPRVAEAVRIPDRDAGGGLARAGQNWGEYVG